jgi:membrane associated rhomboid family serine protease
MLENMNIRKLAFISFGLFIAVSAAYVAYRIAIAIGLSFEWAAAISGVVYTVALLAIDRGSPREWRE